MTRSVLAAFVLATALPVVAQSPEPAPPEAPPPAPEAPKAPAADRFFYGGGIGLSFGTVDYIELAPMVGMRVVPKLDLGLQPFYRWRNDGRYEPDLETSDYGASLFLRYRVIQNFFLQGGYEYTNYEYVTNSFGGTARDDYSAILAGAGYYAPVGRNVGFYAAALYDFAYDDNDPFRPYDSPWRFQLGVSVGF